MGHITNNKRNVRTIKAFRGESLTIDLGKTLSGTLEAWMKKDPNDATYRSFEIKDNRYLVLTKPKSQDYYDKDGKLIEAIAGRWQFDVRQIEDDKDELVFTGTILFLNQVTGSNGVEILDPAIVSPKTFIELYDTPATYGTPGQVPVVNDTGDGLVFADAGSDGGSVVKDNTLSIINLQTITNGTYTYKDRGSTSNLKSGVIFIELPVTEIGKISGRLSIGQYLMGSSQFGSANLVPGEIGFEVNLLSTSAFNSGNRGVITRDPAQYPVVGISKINSDVDTTLSQDFFGFNFDTRVGEIVNNLENLYRTIQFGTVTFDSEVKTGLMIDFGSAEAIPEPESIFLNLLELNVTFKDGVTAHESAFVDKTDYLYMIDSTKYDSFLPLETKALHRI